MFNYDINYFSLIDFIYLYDFLYSRGMKIETIYFNITDLKTSEIHFIKQVISDYTIKAIKNNIRLKLNDKSPNVILPKNIIIDIYNLDKYNAGLNVLISNKNIPTYKDNKNFNKQQQYIINREVDRYKRLFSMIWKNYINRYNVTIKEINTIIRQDLDNYVSIGYLEKTYVTPQQ